MQSLLTSKKAVFHSAEYWIEALGFIIMVIAMVLSSLSGSLLISFINIFLGGMIFGRIWFKNKDQHKTALLLIMLFFLVGYIIGSMYYIKLLYGNWPLKVAFYVVFYLAGMIVSYQLHVKNAIPLSH